MIIYNKTWIANRQIQADLADDLSDGLVTKNEFDAIAINYPVGFYTPHIWVRIGLIILTFIIVVFADGLIFLITGESGFSGSMFFMGGITYILLEVMVKGNNHYHSGVDDALLFIAGSQIVAAFMFMLHPDNDTYQLVASLIIFVVSLYLSLRFAHILAAAVCSAAFFAFIFSGWAKVSSAGLATAPFVMMFAAGGIYWLAVAYGRHIKLTVYQNCISVVKIISLLILYAAGNYFIIQTISNALNNTAPGINKPVPLAPFFWAYTIIVPFIYLGLGVKKKDVMLLRIGLLLIAAAVVTFRTYYHVLPVDIALTIGGALVLGVVYAVINYLKVPKYGFTYAEPKKAHLMDRLKVESLIIAGSFSHAPVAAPTVKDGVKFGGGNFGGGGSSGNF